MKRLTRPIISTNTNTKKKYHPFFVITLTNNKGNPIMNVSAALIRNLNLILDIVIALYQILHYQIKGLVGHLTFVLSVLCTGLSV